jgi:uncharacterized membrane protein HdeD (DUF308 family)
MNLPTWIIFLVAGWVILFGAFRIYIAFRTKAQDEKWKSKGGLYAMPRRTHFLIGIIYLILGTFLLLSAFGWRPFKIG